MVVARRVEGERSEELAVLADHPNLQPVDEDQHPRVDRPWADPDVMQTRVVSKGHDLGDVDLVPTQPEPPGTGRAWFETWLWSRGEWLGRGVPADRAMRADLVLVDAERVE